MKIIKVVNEMFLLQIFSFLFQVGFSYFIVIIIIFVLFSASPKLLKEEDSIEKGVGRICTAKNIADDH